MLKNLAKTSIPTLCSLILFAYDCRAIEMGNVFNQEVGDIVFRQLAPLPTPNYADVHSAVYKGFMRSFGTTSIYETTDSGFNHDAIEMEGITGNKLCGKSIFPFCVASWGGIRTLDLRKFRTMSPPYYGAFSSRNVALNTKQARAIVIETAERLLRSDPQIKYAVVENEAADDLKRKYFTYTAQEGIIGIDQITSMRSDAFVEYCYSSAGMQILQDNIRTVEGASALMDIMRSDTPLYPSDQMAGLNPSAPVSPTMQVYKNGRRLVDGELLPEGNLDIVVTDYESGPKKLKMFSTDFNGAYYDLNRFQELYTHYYSDTAKTEVNRETSRPFVMNPYLKGANTLRAFDHAGNYSDFSFKIPELTAININSAKDALYNNFLGISATAPSTLERSHSFGFSEPVGGVSAVSINGPQGNLWSRTFDPPVFSTATSLADLPVGDYVAKSFNAVGEETRTPFRIGALSVNISTPASAQNYAYHSLLEPGTFYITLHAEAISPDGLNRLQRIEPSSFTLASDNLVEGNTVSLDIAMPPYPQSAVPGATGLVRAMDNAGNIVNNMFELQIAAAAVPAYGEDCIESCTQTVSTDVVNSDFLGNPLLVNYGVYNSTSGPYIFVPGRGPIQAAAVSQWVTQNPPSVFDMAMPLSVGTLRGTLRAWGKEDKSDLVEVPVGEYEVFWDLRTPDSPPFAGAVDCEGVYTFRSPTTHLLLCTREIAPNPVLLQDKKYVELQSIYTRTSSEEVPLCGSLNDGSGNDSCAGYAAQVPPLFNNLTSFIGAALAWQTQSPVGQIPSVPAGNHIYMPLGGYGGLVFSTVVAAGNLPATLAATRPPNGYAESPVNSSYKLTPDEALVFEGPVRLTLKYDAQNLTSSQEGKLKLLRVLDPASGRYDELAATVNAVDKTISADITGFSDFVVAAPEHADPHTAQGGSVIGSFELEFLAGVPATAGQYNMGTETGQAVLAALKSADRLPVGNVYQISTATDTFEPSGAIKMRYNAAAPLMLGVEEDSLALYAFNESGALYRLPFLTLDKESKVLTARVPTAEYPLYAVLGSSVQAENIPPSAYPDGIPPESSLAVHGLAVPVGDGIIVSTRTGIVLSGTDPVLPSVVTSGYKLTNYLLNPDENTVDISTFTVPLVFSEGVHALQYFSVDNALNYEFPRGATIYADGTPPVTGLDGDGLYEADGKEYVAAGSSISLNGYDAPSNGVASGHFGTVYLVGTSSAACPALAQIVANPQAGPPSFVGAPGTCENPLYTEPFTLEEGAWSVTYFSLDRVWNAENARADIIHVDGTPPTAELKINGVAQADGASVQAADGDTITISAEDIISRELASGWATTHMLINITPEACENDGTGGGINGDGTGVGSCENPYYPGPFTLPEGTYAIYYSAADNVGNMAEIKRVNVAVSPKTTLGVAWVSTGSINWTWDAVADAVSYSLSSPLAGNISGNLASNVTSYVQEKLSPNTIYSARLDVASGGGNFSTAVSSAVTLANVPDVPEVFAIGQYPSVVLGQSDLVSRGSGLTQTSLKAPTASAVDSAGNLWVSDSGNLRVLRFPKGQTTGMGADLVIGQPDFVSRQDSMSQNRFSGSLAGIAIDQAGALWVANGCRVLRFSPPFANGMNADLVLGGHSYSYCDNPVNAWGIKFDRNGALWAAGWENDRILRFSPPFTSGQGADLALNWFTYLSSATGIQMTGSFSSPRDIDMDSRGNMYVADFGHDRILGFAPPFYNGMRASLVIGQADFGSYEYGIVSANRLNRPSSVSFDGLDALYVADLGNSRVLKFRPPFSSNMNASLVLGQPDFNTNFNLNVANSFNQNFSAEVDGFIASDSDGRLWVSDTADNRVLSFEPVYTGIFTGVSASGFTVNWLAAGNPAATEYTAEISPDGGFSYGVISSGRTTALSNPFGNLAANTGYYARVRSINLDGVESSWTNLNSVTTVPAAPQGLAGSSADSGSILWTWDAQAGLKYEIFSSTGGQLSPVLPEGTSYYIQSGLEPNRPYSVYLRAINSSGYADTPPLSRFTLSAIPVAVEPFTMGQGVDVTLGGAQGLGESKFGFSGNIGSGPDGSVWVHDTTNCRLLRFPAPQSDYMNAEVVLGQSDFNSTICGVAPDRIAMGGGGVAFDRAGALWLADAINNRVLRFSPPFTNGKAADLVIGQTGLYSKAAGLAGDKLANPSSLSFDWEGNLWVADKGNRRILKFTAPLVTGQSAALVLGQPDFTSKYDIPTSSAYFGPKDIAWDSDGNLWAAVNMVLTEGGLESRLLRFTPPFANGIWPSLILRSAGISFTPYGFVEPEYLAFDETGSMYLTAGDRVLRYAPPFLSDMKPSGVLGKDNFNTNSGGMLQDPRGLAVYNSSSGPVLWVSDPGSFKVVSFNASESSFYDVHPGSVSVKWSITGNPPGTEFQAELSVSRDFGALAAQGAWLNTNTYTFTGLQGNTTYYARVKSRNAEGRESAGAYLGKTLTPSDIVYLAAYSTVTVGAAPEATFLSVYGGSITLVSTTTGSGAYALAAAGGMTLLSNIYEIGPEGDYAPPAIVVFNYSESALAGTGLLEEDLAIYEHFEGIGWVLLPGQSLAAGADKISVPVTRIASLFGVFGVVRDRVAPVTSLVLESGVWRGPAGDTYLNSHSSAALSAYDPVVYGTSTGVAYTEYRVYEGTSSVFARYSGPFGLGEGRRMLEFRSADKAGNLEVAGSSVIYVDASAPETTLSIGGERGLAGWFVSPVEITLVSTDALSGVREINYSLAVSTEYLAYTGQIKISSEGTHAIRYYAADQVGNIELQKNAAPGIDLSAPLVSVALEPVPNSYGWHSSSVAVAFTGTDTVSGLAYCVQAATVSTEGAAQPVSGYCTDRAGWSSTTTVAVSIDLGAPVVSVHVSTAANAAGWHNGDLSVVFTGTDAVSGIEICGPVLPAPPEGRSVVVEGYCSDYAGNRSTTAVTLNIDRSAPLVIVSSPAAGSLFEVGRDQIAVRFSVTDNLDPSPVFSARLRRMQDKGAPGDNRPAELPVVDGQVIESTEMDDGLWRLEITAADAAGNSTATVGGLFEVISDTMPPRTELVVGAPKLAGALTYISTATPLSFTVADDMQMEGDGQGGGAEATYLSIDGAPPTAVKGVVYLYGDGRHELTYHTVDRSGNVEAQQTVAFYVDGLAPEAKMSFEGAFLEDATGVYISTLTSIAVAAAEPASSGAASGLAGVYISDSDGVYDVYAGTFTAPEGEHVYSYYALDRLGNTSRPVSVSLFADGTPPSISIEFSSAPEAVIGGVRVATDTVIAFSAADPPSNGAASGLTGIWYKVDGSSEVPFTDGFTLAQGAHKITYWSADRVGNRSPLAELVVLSGTEMRVVEARLSPDTLNPKSEGAWVEAALSVSSGMAAAFAPGSVLVTRVNGVILSTPIYASWNEHSGADSCKKEGKEGYCSEKVKFDRQALLSVLPAETLSLVTVEGSFEDDAMFSAECQVRVLSLERISRARGGSVTHASAAVEVPAKALKADADISVITLRETAEARRERDFRAAAAALERRGMPYEFGPEGLTFSGTVEISLPYEDYAPATEKLLIAYWNPESREWEPLASTVDPARKVVRARVGHFSEYQVMASAVERAKMAKITSTLSATSSAPLQTGPDPAFRLGEVYVYPNPALRGAAPVLHIETGIADRVKISIYTVSGRPAHEHTLTGMPVALDDGNGLSYAYEYAWRDSVPSGVYYYHIEAEKGGQKIRKSGKFAVVR